MRFVVVALIAGLTSPAFADKTADQLFEDGKRLLAKKQYARACDLLERSFAIDPAIGTQLNIGLCYEKWGRPVEAYKAYAAAAQLAREADDERFSKIRQQLERVARKVARVVIKLPADADPRVELFVDDLPIDRNAEEVPLLPGKYKVIAKVAGKTISEEVELSAGQREVVELDVPRGTATANEKPAAPVKREEPEQPKETETTDEQTEDEVAEPSGPGRKRGRFAGGISLTVVGAGAVGVASYLALDARSRYRAVEAACPGGMCTTPESYAETNAAHDRARQMTYVFAGGVALAAVGIYLIATSKRDEPPPVDAALVITTTDAMVVFGGRL